MKDSGSRMRYFTPRLGYKYLCYLPTGYASNRSRKWPLIIFFHGAMECGDNLDVVKSVGLPRLIEDKKIPYISPPPIMPTSQTLPKGFPFIVVCPQSPTPVWDSSAIDKWIFQIKNKFRVDTKRIYLTGLSVGANCALEVSMFGSHSVAAVLALATTSPPKLSFKNKKRIISAPIWFIHGIADSITSKTTIIRYRNRIDAMGGQTLLSLRKAGHVCWQPAYKTEKVYKWLLKHQK
jgi:predicted peptidase